jgi:hypothetical protein
VVDDQLTPAEIAALVEKSGFPFELTVAHVLLELGFEIQPSVRFFDRSRGKDVELDIVAVSAVETFKTTKGRQANAVLRLVIECKASSLPFVLFGLPAPAAPDPGMMSGDFPYLHINTTRDKGHPNRHSMTAFHTQNNNLRAEHHHFQGDSRFHLATGVEHVGGDPKKRQFKLQAPETLGDALRKLAAFAAHDLKSWQLSIKTIDLEKKEPEKGPFILVTFFLLVHKLPHYRFLRTGEGVIEKHHTPVFTKFETDEGPSYVVVDFISLTGLRAAISTIRDSFRALVSSITPTVIQDKGFPG